MNSAGPTLLLLGALHSVLFALFHLCFPRLFRWRHELPRLSVANRGIMPVLNLCLTFFFVGLGALVAAHRHELLSTPVGHHLLWLLSAFWAFRLAAQFIWFPVRHWASWVLIFLFAAGSALYALPLLWRSPG